MSAKIDEHERDILRVFQSKDETKAYYNKIAKAYDLLAEHSEQPMREKGLARLAAQRGETILEIGFGTGHCLVELADSVGPEGNVHGIDISEEMLKFSSALLAWPTAPRLSAATPNKWIMTTTCSMASS